MKPILTTYLLGLLLPVLMMAQPTSYAFEQGKTAHRQNDLTAAIYHYTLAIEENPQLMDAWYNRGIAHYQAEDFYKARLDFGHILAFQPNDLEAREHLANAEFYDGLYAAAIQNYDKILQIKPTASLYANRGLAKSMMGNEQAALVDFQMALEYEGNNPVYPAQIGDRYFAMEQYKQAVNYYDISIDLKVSDAKVFNNRANAKTYLGEYQSAVYDFNNAILLDYQGQFFANRSFAQLYLGKYELAEADGREATKLEENNHRAYYSMGLSNLNRLLLADAIYYFDKAIEIEKNDAAYYSDRGVAKYMLEDFYGAQADFQTALSLNPTLSETQRLLALVETELRTEEDMGDWQTFLPTAQQNPVGSRSTTVSAPASFQWDD